MYSRIKIDLQAGFTLMELMMVVVIVGILVAIGLPAYTNLTMDNCLTTKTNNMITSMHLARSEAVRRRAAVSLVAINPQATNEWGNGWNIVVGIAANGALIRQFDAQCPATMDETNTDATVYTYRPDGFIANPGIIDVCDDRTAELGRQITVNVTGRPNLNNAFQCP